ncbi:hypothetical protein [Limnoraphis robusta]|uniref:Chromosome segregation ATPase n=1 Tax=Limnoraphis robusta CCNP1315 TaxID=3110306 RepID=A0ABU5U491_9CYAN|nr:hypothetical protein [Limnoraphis robusta]MEA5521712.1 hypothetical protein [Limnoraphis robusta CCNP1315]MEA5548806.1 hypothetical protein [Limnoraphis robusta CCNP1324]
MSEKHKKQSRWIERLSTQPGKDPQLSAQPLSLRKSRAERLKELRALLESGLEEQSTQPPKTDPQPETVIPQTLAIPPSEPIPEPPPRAPKQSKGALVLKLTPLWLVLMILTPGGVGYLASSMLLRSPSLPNCPKIFWPIASASLRLYCAETAAKKETVQDLLVAIELVDGLSKTHPLRPEINRRIEQWSLDILDLSENLFQAGELKKAIESARKVPQDTPAMAKVEERIKEWNALWKEAEGIYRKAEDHLRQEQTNLAFREATRLLNMGNQYWETTKYQELTDFVQIVREESKKLAEARGIAEQGGFDNIIEAIKKAEVIGSESYLYDRATKAITEYSKTALNLAEENLKTGDWQRSINMAQQIPKRANLDKEVEDFILLSRAHIPASLDTVEGLKDAIAQARKINVGRPFHNKAQQYIRDWQQAISDVATLEKARKLARSGAVKDLKAAVAELRSIPTSNPRGDDAQVQMVRWNQKIEEIEDRPLLENADQLASFGDVKSLKEAISQAQQISQGRALYDEAQDRISEWAERSQRLEFQPILDRAVQIASDGDLAQAISVAEQIKPGIVLYPEAKMKVDGWKAELQDTKNVQDAENIAASGTVDSYVKAIQLASQVSPSSSWRGRADRLIGEWSQEILDIGLDQSVYDLPAAIATLKKIPYGTNAFNAAQPQIQTWEGWLNPPPPQPEPQPEPEPEPPRSNDYNDYGNYDDGYNYNNEDGYQDYNSQPYQPIQQTPTLQPQISPSEIYNDSVELNKPITVNKVSDIR